MGHLQSEWAVQWQSNLRVHDKLPEYYSKGQPSQKTHLHEVCRRAANLRKVDPKNRKQELGWSATWKKRELAGSSCIQIKDLVSSHLAWVIRNYQDVPGCPRKCKEMQGSGRNLVIWTNTTILKEVPGKTRKLKEWGNSENRKWQEVAGSDLGKSRKYKDPWGIRGKWEERPGSGMIYQDVERFTGKLKEIVLFRALHLVLSDKSHEKIQKCSHVVRWHIR